ncbi:MAG: DUF488 family protein [Chlamydiae bacterium]|nr:DUF488 family protein [Chlamydiota bacterium]
MTAAVVFPNVGSTFKTASPLMLKLKNLYDMPLEEDGQRILIERLWPREADLYTMKIRRWLKDLAPSYALLEWSREHPNLGLKFRENYLKELEAADKKVQLCDLADEALKGVVTLLYAEEEVEKTPAKVIYDWLTQKMGIERG